jgi:DNA-binding XRE family transcriptional regulator
MVHQQEKHAKEKCAKTMGVSRSGYYTWKKERSHRKARETKIRKKVVDLFHNSG